MHLFRGLAPVRFHVRPDGRCIPKVQLPTLGKKEQIVELIEHVLAGLVNDRNDGLPLVGELPKEPDQRRGGRRIKSRRWLVQKDAGGGGNHLDRNAKPLPFSAGYSSHFGVPHDRVGGLR